MGNLLKKAVLAVLGVGVMIGWWEVKAWFRGGGGPITIEAEVSHPGVVSASFETNIPVDDEDHKFMESWERIDAGLHTFTVDVPRDVGGTAEVRIDDPPVGATVRIALKAGGRTLAEDSATLESPLQPGYGFAAQIALGDYLTGTPSED